eukprot:TRINITY_DN798_c0_g1_i13.p1 TRINITY_DN798_c0_g1~~TRINITY_DN798_c0_g1_i13.p1  ORF type:complete len:876 (+),score=269.51 TRINITY_DN798_c0_g1_i13:63-2630(+)
MLSIRLLNISLVLGCIIVTAVLCLTLAVTSSEDALDKTKQSRDTSVKDAFAVGEASVLRSVDENMNTLGNEALEFLSSFFTSHRLTAQAALGIFQMPAPGDLEPSWETIYSHRSTMWNMMFTNNMAGLTVLGLTTHDYKVLGISELSGTLLRGPDEYHHLLYLLSNGTAYDNQAWFNGVQGVPAKNRLIATSALPWTGDAHDFPDNVGNVLLGTCTFEFPQAFATNGSVLDRACSLDTLPFADAHSTSWLFPSTKQGPEGMRWSSPVNIGVGGYSIMYIYGIYGHSALTKVGQVYGGVDLRTITRFVRSIEIGVRSDGGESYGRLYTAVRSFWLTPGTPVTLVAVSHGNATVDDTVDDNTVALPLAPVNATDPVISETASAIETKLGGYDAVMNATVLQNYTIATNRTPDGEGFYVKVREFYDKFGIDWYVVIIVDREYILGEIVRNTQQTQQDIATSEKQVDDDQRKARAIMYVTVGCCAMVMVVLCVVLVVKITAPLLQLESQMALVAVMDLKNVDLKEKSSLSEVRGMQESFAVMIANLVEYREYMPASVLVDPKDTDSEDSATYSAARSATHSNGGTHSRMSSGGTTERLVHAAARMADLRVKKVSLGVLNMKGWLSKPDPVSTHKAYLEVVLYEATARKTIVDEFNGDRVYISGNGARQLNGHSIEMGRVLLTVSRRCEGMGIKVSGVATAGKAQCGNIGCQGLKKYSFVGPLSSWLHMMGLISGRYEEAPVVVDDPFKRDLGTSFLLKIVDRVMYEKLHQHGILLHHLVAESEGVAENEWMYQLEEGDRSNPFRSHDAVMEAALKTNYDEAATLLDNVREGSHKEHLKQDVEKLRTGGVGRYLLHLDGL